MTSLRCVVSVVLVLAATPVSPYLVTTSPVAASRAAPCASPRAAVLVAKQPETQQPSLWRRVLRNPWRSVASAVTLGAASVMLQQKPAMAAVVAPPKTTTTKKLKKKPKPVSSALPTMVMMGGFAYYSWSSARAEDEEETVRIKDETEKMEQLSKEFTEIDEAVTVDEDLLASLKKRMGNSTNTTSGEGGEGPSGGNGGGPPGDSPPKIDNGDGTAVMERPDATPAEEPSTGMDADAIARLNKMMGLPDAEK